MKPADRALDIVAIGLGQGGGNIAAEFGRLGYHALALNTAHTDLSALAPGGNDASLSRDQRIYIGLDGYDGAGADLNYGRECIRENAERIREAVRAHAEGADVVVLAAGLGGGTGSALSELVDVLEDMELPIITLATLPGEHESGIAKVNAARGLSELVKRRSYGWIFADNQRLAQLHGNVPLDRYFEAINQVIVAPLDALNRLNEREDVHPLRTLDGEDFRRLLLSSGVLNYAEATLAQLTVEAVLEGIREALLSSGVMPAGFSMQEVAYMGIVLEAPESTLAGTPFSFFEQLSEQLKNDTGGGAIYLGMYRTPEIPGGAARLRLIGSSQSLPSGIQAVVNDAKREGGTLRDKLRRAVDALDLGEIEDFDLFKTHARSGTSRRRLPQPPEVHQVEVEAGFDGYLTPTQTTPAPAPSSELPEALQATLQDLVPAPPPSFEVAPPAFEVASSGFEVAPPAFEVARPGFEVPLPHFDTSARHFDDSSDEAADTNGSDFEMPTNIPPSGPVNRSLSESDTYTKLADAFLAASSESIRQRIARRLDVAQNSESVLIREHAALAISRIRSVEPEAFDAALSMLAERQLAKG